MAGAIADGLTRQNAMRYRLHRAQKQVSELQAALAGAENALAWRQKTLDALDATLNLAYSAVNPAAAGTVNARVGKYGKLGGLKEYLLQTLKDAAPVPVTTSLLINFAANHFGLVFNGPEHRQSLRKSVKSAMHSGVKSGLVEIVPNPTARGTSAWRWKEEDDFPSFEEMAREEQEIRRGD